MEPKITWLLTSTVLLIKDFFEAKLVQLTQVSLNRRNAILWSNLLRRRCKKRDKGLQLAVPEKQQGRIEYQGLN